jgi:tetratricopeptide (TPR) repeat protein
MVPIVKRMREINFLLAAHRLVKEARKVYEEALQISRALAQKNAESYLPDVAETLNRLGVLDRDENRPGEAQKTLKEALMIRREFAQKNPEVYLPSVAETFGNLAVLDRSQSRLEDARLASEEALTIYQDFAKQDSEQFSPDVTRVKKLLEQLQNTPRP